MIISEILKHALDAVWEASHCCETIAENFRHNDSQTKGDASPVTIADYASQALLIHRLTEMTPDLGIVAEEEGDELKSQPEMCDRIVEFVREFEPKLTRDNLLSWMDRGNQLEKDPKRFWTLDPIDGTKGYLRGGQYAVALSLIERGKPILGILGCPRYQEGDLKHKGMVFYGGADIPAAMVSSETATPRTIRVCDTVPPPEARLCESVESGHTSHERSAKLIDILGISKDVLRMDSQAKYAAVAHGAAALYMRLPVKKGYREKIWDHAAGVAVIEAAGGKVTDLNGKKLDFSLGETLSANRGVLATNGALHHATLAALQTLTPEESKWE
ncbi:MAG: 3'(2'),5'-bisphosphate nucleotidase [Verrucomicrobia bacterium]|nr:3'(2'),5'-bisphosphate nucleotidase [Verrucomicrobiota bacterium]MCH8511829.1 3'(2'),5'-bisphosphate nucleotidase [Kiritimatiellia bacterium]